MDQGIFFNDGDAMIEVERKFQITEEGKRALTDGAEFVSEKIMTDTYYDTADLQLTTKDRWLRLRDGKWELKEPLHALGFSKRAADQYRELTTEGEIRAALRLPAGNDLGADLAKTGYEPFATIKTIRRKYKKEGFVIDLDVMDFGYEIGEIELMVQSESDMLGAVDRIRGFAQKHGLELLPVRGKVLEFILRFRLNHYQSLEKAGIL